ncbi:hypothetical protein P154DRAFT_618665 [Amniculicola lignicola CBS 123094]|uniref:Mid2 domain-containing protein n=1 Tax=Amniculicola lignicola CBS 123094 TaxID=1392246 RepID=A0A6A5WT51_9PLEO|nr:hypothetical protein P154DRAFT_618665 [Amniculicola lignicola CBS 123094]
MRSSTVATSIALLFSASAYAFLEPTSPANPADPTITPGPQVELRQENQRFMGWLSFSGTWTSRQCDIGGTLYQTSDFWRCCATTVASCNVPVGCISGSLIYTFTTGSVTRGTYACTDIYTDPEDSSFTICNTGFLFENSQDSDPRTNVFCGISSLNWSYFRVLPSTTSSEISTPSSTPPITSSTPSSTIDPTSTSSTPSPTPSPNPEPKKKSQAWIAGAVVGPVVGLALVGFLLWFCLFRKKNKKETVVPANPNQSYPASPNPPQAYATYPNGQPPMEQGGPGGMTPYGVTKHESWAPGSPTQTQGSHSPMPTASPVYSQQGQQWQGMSPQQQYADPAQGGFVGGEQPKHEGQRQFSSELEGSPSPYQAMPPQQGVPPQSEWVQPPNSPPPGIAQQQGHA